MRVRRHLPPPPATAILLLVTAPCRHRRSARGRSLQTSRRLPPPPSRSPSPYHEALAPLLVGTAALQQDAHRKLLATSRRSPLAPPRRSTRLSGATRHFLSTPPLCNWTLTANLPPPPAAALPLPVTIARGSRVLRATSHQCCRSATGHSPHASRRLPLPPYCSSSLQLVNAAALQLVTRRLPQAYRHLPPLPSRSPSP